MSGDLQAATGQQPYEPARCECGELVTVHAFNTKGQRAACSGSTCPCKRFVAATEVAVAPKTVSCIQCESDSVGLCCSSHKAALCHRCYRLTHFVEICGSACDSCAREGLDPTKAVA